MIAYSSRMQALYDTKQVSNESYECIKNNDLCKSVNFTPYLSNTGHVCAIPLFVDSLTNTYR